MLTAVDGLVTWSDPAPAIDRRVRGVTPAPGAHTSYRGVRLRLGPVEPVPGITDLPPGALRAAGREVTMHHLSLLSEE